MFNSRPLEVTFHWGTVPLKPRDHDWEHKKKLLLLPLTLRESRNRVNTSLPSHKISCMDPRISSQAIRGEKLCFEPAQVFVMSACS